MSFWTVEDAGPYKKYPNILIRRSLYSALYIYMRLTFEHRIRDSGRFVNRPYESFRLLF